LDIASAWFARAEAWSQPEQNNEYFLHHRRGGRDPCGRQFYRTAYLKNFLASGGLLTEATVCGRSPTLP
jgi:hypothetical protein